MPYFIRDINHTATVLDGKQVYGIQGRSSDSPARPSAFPLIFFESSGSLDAGLPIHLHGISAGVTAAGPFPIFAGFPFKPSWHLSSGLLAQDAG